MEYANDESYRKEVPVAAIFNRFEFEYSKFCRLQRIFVAIDKELKSRKVSFVQLLRQYDVFDPKDKQRIKGRAFCKMLDKLGVINSTQEEEVKPIFEEYGITDENDDYEDAFNDEIENQDGNILNSKGNNSKSDSKGQDPDTVSEDGDRQK